MPFLSFDAVYVGSPVINRGVGRCLIYGCPTIPSPVNSLWGFYYYYYQVYQLSTGGFAQKQSLYEVLHH